MGLDAGHMTYPELSQAVPAAFAQYIVGQAVMHTLRTQFGLPVIDIDGRMANPEWATSMMRHWRRGAGGTSVGAGLAFVDGHGGLADPSRLAPTHPTRSGLPTRPTRLGLTKK